MDLKEILLAALVSIGLVLVVLFLYWAKCKIALAVFGW